MEDRDKIIAVVALGALFTFGLIVVFGMESSAKTELYRANVRIECVKAGGSFEQKSYTEFSCKRG